MWQAARQQDKKIKELMVDHKKRAEKRRAYYESKIGDPKQLLRIVGASVKLYPDADQFYHHENMNNLTVWQGDNNTRIDRFDGRALLDMLPSRSGPIALESRQDRDIADELNFERYRDLVEVDRLEVSEQDRLEEIEEEWINILARHKALLAMLNPKKEEKKQQSFRYDYGTNDVQADAQQGNAEDEEVQELLKEADILSYIDDLSDVDRQKLDQLASKYNIKHYVHLLHGARKDRDNQLEDLRRQQQKGGKSWRRRRRDYSERVRRYSSDSSTSKSYNRRTSPTYEPYGNSSESEASGDDPPANVESDDFIVFGTSSERYSETAIQETSKRVPVEPNSSTVNTTNRAVPQKVEKKLTPMEKLKMKMRAAFDDQIEKDEQMKRKKERDAEIDKLHATNNSEALLQLTMSSQTARRESKTTDARPNTQSVSDRDRPRKRYYSPDSRSPSPRRRRHRSRSRDREMRKRSRSRSSDRSRSRGHNSCRRRSHTRSRSRGR